MKLTEKQMIDLISEELEEMFAPGADGEEYEPEGPKPMEVLSEYKELIRLLNSEPQEYRKKQTYFQANKVFSMLLELSGYDPIMQEMLGVMPEQAGELRIDAPDETLEREVQDIIKGYKEEQVYKARRKEPTFEEFMNFYRTHSQVNQAVVDYAKKTVYKDVEAQLTEMPRRNPKTGEPMGPEAQKLYSMRRPPIGRARGAYKPRDVDTGAIVQGAIANLLRDNPGVTLSVSAEDAAAIQNDPSIDQTIKDRLMTPKQ